MQYLLVLVLIGFTCRFCSAWHREPFAGSAGVGAAKVRLSAIMLFTDL